MIISVVCISELCTVISPHTHVSKTLQTSNMSQGTKLSPNFYLDHSVEWGRKFSKSVGTAMYPLFGRDCVSNLVLFAWNWAHVTEMVLLTLIVLLTYLENGQNDILTSRIFIIMPFDIYTMRRR